MGRFNYFNWLQKGNPTGTPSQFPELDNGFETSVPGLYCIGDLTGIPLIKPAAESGAKVIEQISSDPSFEAGVSELDLIICGAGPAGVSAAREALKRDWSVLILEAAVPFNTIRNFPAGKPIFVTPVETPFESELTFSDGDKESLLNEFDRELSLFNLPIKQGVKVDAIHEFSKGFTVKTSDGDFHSQRVVVAIGTSGNARRLGVPGEELPKVLNRLIDPRDYSDKDILIVGGGDSALESAVALAKTGNRVSLSYRKEVFARPKSQNLDAFNEEVDAGRITPYFSSNILEIDEKTVLLNSGTGEQKLRNDNVFTMIGTEIPIGFFERSNIKMEGEKSLHWWIHLITMILFFSMLYFGKAGPAFELVRESGSLSENIYSYITGPFTLNLSWNFADGEWYKTLNFLLGWLSSTLFVPFGLVTLWGFVFRSKRYMRSTWGKIKSLYIIGAAILFITVYVKSQLGQNAGWVEEPTYWYSLLYCTTMILFGVRRMIVKPTKYIRWQTSVLILIQVFFMFLLPFHLYDFLIGGTLSNHSWVIQELFPKGKWSSFGFILFWPLNISDFGASAFWTWFPLFQTFILLPIIVYFFGKGGYCGWICSCGGMAETLGDEYRHTALHGPEAKKWENAGQFVLLFALISTIIHHSAIGVLSNTLWWGYKFLVDIIFAGILGLGVYFFFSGRFWCRFLCPLAALMHIYARFSRYRIFSDKKRCISCNLCTKSCHMGIDVMNYANKGVPLDDVQCVACSSCITSCPMDVLSFGMVKNGKDKRLIPDSEK